MKVCSPFAESNLFPDHILQAKHVHLAVETPLLMLVRVNWKDGIDVSALWGGLWSLVPGQSGSKHCILGYLRCGARAEDNL